MLKVLADHNRKETAFLSYLSHPDFKVLSCLLKYFGHIQSKNKDTKSVISYKSNIAISSSNTSGVEMVKVLMALFMCE